MSNLIAFLRARLDEDAAEITQQPDEDRSTEWDLIATDEIYSCFKYLRLGKKRALAELDHKRQILTDHEGVHRCDWGDQMGAEYLGWCTPARRLAAIYANHPDYDKDWRL